MTPPLRWIRRQALALILSPGFGVPNLYFSRFGDFAYYIPDYIPDVLDSRFRHDEFAWRRASLYFTPFVRSTSLSATTGENCLRRERVTDSKHEANLQGPSANLQPRGSVPHDPNLL